MEFAPAIDNTYQAYLRTGRLMGTRCAACGETAFPPRAVCTSCGSSQVEWVELSGQGKLVAFTIISVPTTEMAAEGYDRTHPYCVGIVELGDGLRASARILDVDVEHPDSIQIGQPVTVEFLRPDGAARVTLAFRAVQGKE